MLLMVNRILLADVSGNGACRPRRAQAYLKTLSAAMPFCGLPSRVMALPVGEAHGSKSA
jgi:hypothetical protein